LGGHRALNLPNIDQTFSFPLWKLWGGLSDFFKNKNCLQIEIEIKNLECAILFKYLVCCRCIFWGYQTIDTDWGVFMATCAYQFVCLWPEHGRNLLEVLMSWFEDVNFEMAWVRISPKIRVLVHSEIFFFKKFMGFIYFLQFLS
jgi:hypothetical protein